MSNETLNLRQSDYAVPATAEQWQKRAMIAGVVGVIICIAGAVLSLDQFLRGYLIAYMFWTGLSLGCLALLMVQYLSGGFWGLSIRRVLEASSKGLPLMFVLFLPILFGRHHLYEWMNDPSLTDHNSWYLHTGGLGGWYARWIIYFVDLDWVGHRAEQAWRPARQSSDGAAALPGIERIRAGAVFLVDFVRGGRLGHVARSALGFDHLRPHLHCGTRPVGAVRFA